MMKKIGFGLLIADLFFTTYLLVSTRIELVRVAPVTILFLIIGLVLFFYERITGFKYKDFEMRTVTEKAIAEAKQIEEIYLEVRAQKEALDLIVRDANATRKELLEIKSMTEEAYSRLLHTEQIAKEAEKNSKKAKEEAVDEVFDKLVKAIR